MLTNACRSFWFSFSLLDYKNIKLESDLKTSRGYNNLKRDLLDSIYICDQVKFKLLWHFLWLPHPHTVILDPWRKLSRMVPGIMYGNPCTMESSHSCRHSIRAFFKCLSKYVSIFSPHVNFCFVRLPLVVGGLCFSVSSCMMFSCNCRRYTMNIKFCVDILYWRNPLPTLRHRHISVLFNMPFIS